MDKTWRIRRQGYNIRCRDSFDDKLPRLTREYNQDGDEQELVVYRDVPYDVNSAIAVLPIIKQYQPDVVVFEYGRLPFFDKYIDSRLTFSNLMLSFKKLLAMITPFKGLQTGLGKILYGTSKKLYTTEISSYGFESCLDFIWRQSHKKNGMKIPIVAGDIHHKITDTLRVFNDYLDLYNIATLLHYGLIDSKMVKSAAKLKLGDNSSNILQMRLYPHMTSMNVYRNDVLSCVINELDPIKYKKILLISQPMRLKDLYDKLCGKSKINKWIKSMDNEQHVLMNKLNSFEYKLTMTNKKNTYLQNKIQSEYEDDLAKCINYLGYDQTAFLLLEYPLNELFDKDKPNRDKVMNMNSDNLEEQEFVEEVKGKINEISTNLKTKYN